MTDRFLDEPVVGDVGNLLFLFPAFAPLSDELCSTLLADGSPADSTLLFVTATRSPDDRFDAWRSHADASVPVRVGFVDIGDRPRSDDGGSTVSVRADGCEVRVESVPDPGNLTKVGISLTTLLTEWPGEGDRIAVCFESLTTLLQYVDVKTLYRFLHVLTRQIRTLGASAHYHLDPTAHDEQTVSQLLSLFDATVEPDGSGQWRVRTR